MSSTEYSAFVERKSQLDVNHGFEPSFLPDFLFDFQRALVEWAVRKGRAALFTDCGTGKSPMQLVWAENVVRETCKPVLVLTPLAVGTQLLTEAEKFGIEAERSKDGAPGRGITVSNYERLERFSPDDFGGIVCDESSILKNFDGATKQLVTAFARKMRYRLLCTATAAPNDYIELGTSSEALGYLGHMDMLGKFFKNDQNTSRAVRLWSGSTWRFKGHARQHFWRWVCSWAVMLRNPADLGYDGTQYVLPPITYHDHIIEVDPLSVGVLFEHESLSLQERRRARKVSITQRVEQLAGLANGSTEPWFIICDLNAEGDMLEAAIPGSVNVEGSDERDVKERALNEFAMGERRVLISKSKIAGLGLNLQHCRNVAFVGVTDSFEAMYQTIRRCWRFGQRQHVNVHIFASTNDDCVLANVRRKEADAETMFQEMARHMHDLNNEEVHGTTRSEATYSEDVAHGDGWELRLGDCVEAISNMEAESIDYSIFSPPFASLYTYSNSDRDMGNCGDADEFAEHLKFLIYQLARVTKPGRLVSFHCMNLPTSKVRDGVIGISDFRGSLIRAFEDSGWIYHSEVCIWKDPVTAMQRTKALGLLHKQLKKDSCMSRQGIPDYLVTMRKPGENASRVEHTNETFPVSEWQRIASPVWMDIEPNDTLQYASARDEKDERHICPLQLEVIRRGLRLWSKPGDLVLSPFAGIGSEGHVALEMGRRFVGVELKRSYWEQAVRNLQASIASRAQKELFA